MAHKIGLLRASLLALGTLVASSSAWALTQPDGATIPAPMGCSGSSPTGLAPAFACVCEQTGSCNIGAPCPGGSSSCDPGQNGKCETTLWHDVNDNACIPSNSSGIDPLSDGAVVPETFHPTCPQTFTLITRGTAIFQNAFGWYNATGNKPATSDLHVMLDCNAKPGDKSVLDLSQEPGYAGGDIGFFLVTPEKSDGQNGGTGSCDSLGCCATLAGAEQGKGFVYYSERELNPDYAGGTSWIHLLSYQSQIFQDVFYFAWEDSNKSPNNDFTDLLTSVSGIRCSGAGVACDTGAKGVCGQGLTVCKQGVLSCEPVFSAGGEECNGLDDDCNGSVDDGATCPKPGQVCHQGTCLGPCTTPEFPCYAGDECDEQTGLCVAPSCAGVTCAEGEICSAGKCVAPCSDVVCPHGQSCVGNECVDLCAGVTCSGGEICDRGKCFPSCAQCDGLSCEKPLSCDEKTGLCADLSCPGGCPAGSYCEAGQCKDACDGVVCPSGQSCSAGQCCSAAQCGAGGGDAGIPLGGSGGVGGNAGSGANGTVPGSSDSGSSGCSCRATEGGGQAASAAWLGLIFGAWRGRRRRRR